MREPIPQDVRLEVFYRDDWKCFFCGSSRKMTIDHILEVWAGGTNEMGNLRVLCQDCHRKRHHIQKKPKNNQRPPAKVDQHRLLPKFRSIDV